MTRGLFITGTDTGVGKTVVACALLRNWAAQGRRAVGMKPVAAGIAAGAACNEDVAALAAAGNVEAPLRFRNPFAFAPAIAPHLAAAEAGVPIDLARIRTAYEVLAGRADRVAVEGAGGVFVPLDARRDMLDIALALSLPVVLVIALLIGIVSALAAVIIPSWRAARESSVRASRARIGRAQAPFWERTWIDVVLLVIAGLVYWRTAATGYQIVLAPEGVPATSVSYESFLAPLALWIGFGLLVTRVFRHGLVAGRAVVARVFRPLGGSMTPIVSASVSRQARLITRGVVLVTLAFSFAVSTAVFNTTYNVQSRVDAALTNGADVTITGTTAYPAGQLLDPASKVPGVHAARAMMHRFAYVGNDLQDLYGVDPLAIGDATDLSNAFFASNDAKGTMQKLAAQHDGALLSQELAVAVEQQDVGVAGRRDRAQGDARGVVVDVEAGDALPGRQADAARVPARDLRLPGGRFPRRDRHGSRKEHEAGQGHGE